MDAIVDQAFQAQRGRYYFLFDCAEYGDKLKVLKFRVDEQVSKPYKIKVELATRNKIDPRKLNDRPGRLTIVDKHHPQKRYYCGIVAKAVQKDKGFKDGFTRFSVTLRPELYFAKFRHDNRIFQNLTIPEIVNQKLDEIGVTRRNWLLWEKHERREYVVQYKLSDLQFVERLLASEGIPYAFVHHEDGAELVMFDNSAPMPICPGAEELEYNATAGSEVRGQIVKRFAWAETVGTNVATFREQHFKNPVVRFEYGSGSDAGNGQQRTLEKYTFPGYYKADDTGRQAALYEINSLQADASEGSGAGHAQFLAAGQRFALKGHDDKRYNDKYFLVSVRQSGRQTNVEEEFATEGDGTFLETKFTCVRETTPWRPSRPEVQQTDGTHLATVCGPPGEVVYCDEWGRVKVFFHWDRKGKEDDSASCWVRVSQGWAGAQYGSMMIPRIGQSVIVSYINNDIEQPVITGRLYNAVQQPPYKLPDNKTKSVWRSDTHKGRGHNEFSLEDEAGAEQIYMHAQKDHDTIVNNDETMWIGHDRSKSVEHDQSEKIGNNKSTFVGQDHDETIGRDERVNIGNDVFYEVGRNQWETYGKDYIQNVGNILKQTVVFDHRYETGGSLAGQVNGKYRLDVGESITTTTGKHTLLAFEKFVISGPGSKITLDGSSITLEAAVINLKGAVNMGGSGSGTARTLALAANEGLPLAEECANPDEAQ